MMRTSTGAPPGMSTHPILAQVRAALPGMRLLTKPAAVEPYRRDETEFLPAGRPIAVAFPTTAAGVSTIVRLAAASQVPVVTRGGGTGLSGGANAIDGGIVIVMTGLDRILEIATDDLLVVTQAGVITAELERAVEARGLFYPPDPASLRDQHHRRQPRRERRRPALREVRSDA